MGAWRPSATRRALELRAESHRRVRAFFAERGMLEVETPALSASAPTDRHIHPLHTEVAGQGRRYLQSSPEFPMKRLVAAGFGDCWQACRVFRDGEDGRLHNPEFTLVEWYRTGWDDARLIDEVDALVRTVLSGHRDLQPATRITWSEAFEAVTGRAPGTVGIDSGRDLLAAAGVEAPASADESELQNLVMGAVVAPRLGHDAPCFVTDWPIAQAALARPRDDDPTRAARFELFIDGIELCNGFHELCDPVEQRARFDADNALRRAAGVPAMPVDRNLIAALESGLPDCAGVAVGFDRLIMLALGTADIRDVLAFPVDRA
jgi:elongation factor P--(R)-beta-lysine ligase